MRVEVEGWVAFPTPGSVLRALRGGAEVRFMLIYRVSLSWRLTVPGDSEPVAQVVLINGQKALAHLESYNSALHWETGPKVRIRVQHLRGTQNLSNQNNILMQCLKKTIAYNRMNKA